MRTSNKSIILILAIGFYLMFITPVHAKVEGQCSNCHTMHNSQGGSHMIINTTIDGENSGVHGGGYPALTRGSCVGCHTGENTGSNTTPYVYDTGSVFYGINTLAGGNFKWVLDDDACGHNVSGIPTMTGDIALESGAPGNYHNCTDSCHLTLFNPVAGDTLDTGCEGCHLAPKHHAPQQGAGTVATVDNGYFRFLSGHMSGEGVHGIEDPDWEYNADSLFHNEYLGDDGTNIKYTMSNYCVGCHGKFHVQQDGNDKWIRHPSDAVLPVDGEYAAYTVYDPNVPVARPSLTTVSGTVTPGTDMVMCLSCHRAHGSPYPDMLRWNYTNMDAGGGPNDTGCFKCHSEKD